MKYITHMSSSQEDDKHVAAMAAAGGGKEGWAIYGVYWAIAEKIAAQIRPEQIVTWVTKPWSKWASDLSTKPHWARTALQLLADCNLIDLYLNDKAACVNMPNLLKYGDEYLKSILRKSGETPESIGRKFVVPSFLLSYKSKSLRTGPVDNVDNSPQGDGARAADGGVLEAPPPPAPTLLLEKPQRENSPPTDDEVHRLGDIIKRKQQELGITIRSPAEIIGDNILAGVKKTDIKATTR